jgi:hypothetical protein
MTLEYAGYNVKVYAVPEYIVNSFPGILDNGSVPGSPARSFNELDILP